MRALLVIACMAAAAHAEPIAVKVVEVAGGVAYVTPGRAAGLAPGVTVRIRGRELKVIEATEKTASLRADTGALAIGDAGSANVDRAAATATRQLRKPRAARDLVGQWPDAVMPADTQTPTSVPLGAAHSPGRAHVTLIGHGYGAVQRGGAAGDAEARMIATFDLLQDRPLAADLDVAGRMFSGGFDAQTHAPLFVRAAQLRYGSAADPQLALGRLRFAATSVGMLDGGRAGARFGSLELAAFGGVLPDPLSGKPDRSASRFGGELVFDDRQASWQPRVAVVAYGSTWQGTLDERRLTVVGSANHASTWLDGWAEAQQFPAGNPWNAKPVELTGAGGTFAWREQGSHVGLGLTYLRPERSLRLASVLPPEWLCTLSPQPGVATETCAGGDYWVSASANAGMRTTHWAVDAVGTAGRSHGVFRGFDASAYVRGEIFVGPGRLVTGASTGQSGFLTWRSAEIGFGAALWHLIDAVATYRPEILDYSASTGLTVLHSLVVDAHYAMSASYDIGASALLSAGPDRRAAALLATVVWRPLP